VNIVDNGNGKKKLEAIVVLNEGKAARLPELNKKKKKEKEEGRRQEGWRRELNI
jgi:hypothetical protein